MEQIDFDIARRIIDLMSYQNCKYDDLALRALEIKIYHLNSIIKIEKKNEPFIFFKKKREKWRVGLKDLEDQLSDAHNEWKQITNDKEIFYNELDK